MTQPAFSLAPEQAETNGAMAELRMRLAGTDIALDPAGALWLPTSRTLIVADLHLEKASALARRRGALASGSCTPEMTVLWGRAPRGIVACPEREL